MKRFAILLVTILYCTFAIGIIVNKHFCNGKLLFVTFFHTISEKDCCGDNHKKDCCDDKNQIIKVTDNHQVAACVGINKTIINCLPFAADGNKFSIQSVAGKKVSIFISPPDILRQRPIYIQNRVFLI